jgi:choline dehydrogenase
VRTHALATRVLFDERRRAIGVEYLAGQRLYRADPRARADAAAERVTVTAAREVVLCAGAFNTPQLLKLSGIGPREELARLGIPVVADRPGVGENLQDRYEASVVSRATREFALMEGVTLRPPAPNEPEDPPLREWRNGKGPYTTNGALISMIRRSSSARDDPDLYLFALLGSFDGYYPGYSQRIAQEKDLFTWAVLKAHTHNRAGRVRLRSADPRDTPRIDFNYFEGERAAEDLDAVVDGVEAVRAINRRCADIVREELVPGEGVRTRDDLRRYIRDNAWGHHACGTCRIGPDGDPMAVVDSRFRVHGTRGLRIVDASVFPRIPGFFIACAVYMIAEKAAQAIAEDAGA